MGRGGRREGLICITDRDCIDTAIRPCSTRRADPRRAGRRIDEQQERRRRHCQAPARAGASEFGITANAICPGYVWTPLVEQQIDDQAKSHGISRDRVIKEVLLAKQPTKKFAQASQIGELAVFLASDAAQSLTGAALPVDGGWVAQ
jgi:hypothetical protein